MLVPYIQLYTYIHTHIHFLVIKCYFLICEGGNSLVKNVIRQQCYALNSHKKWGHEQEILVQKGVLGIMMGLI